MSVGSRIRELREDRNITRSAFADLLGVTVGAISNYENEVSSPKEPILFKIMEVLECDANYLFQDAVKISPMKNNVSIEEYNVIKKYRDLDDHGKEMVDFTLEKEWERSTAQKDNIVEMTQHLQANAAQIRTDVDIPEEIDTSENDIMDAKDF